MPVIVENEDKGLRVDLSQARWRKSSASGPYSDNCVEVTQASGMEAWHRATRSAANGACVEVAGRVGGVAVRDSKDPDGPVLLFTQAEWDAFVVGVKGGEFDL